MTTGFPTVLALIEKEQFAATAPSEFGDDSASWNQLKPCELYVCNLPSGCDISQLLEIFKPFGTVQSVEVLLPSSTFTTLLNFGLQFSLSLAFMFLSKFKNLSWIGLFLI